jgi:hypothetical protein
MKYEAIMSAAFQIGTKQRRAKYKLRADLLIAQKFRQFSFPCGNGMVNRRLRTGPSVHQAITSAINRVEFASQRMPYNCQEVSRGPSDLTSDPPSRGL